MGSGHPRRGVDYPGTFGEFRSWFPTETACRDYLEQLRWPGGFACPVCDGKQAWRTAKGMWMCSNCGRKTSVTAGTIFHRSRTPLLTWFAAVWFLTSQKNGISALALQQQLGFGSYETAWAWLHKLRRAMVRPDRDLLSGVVELDTTYVGGQTQGTDGMGTEKVPVMVAVERIGPHKLGRVRLGLAYGLGSLQLVDFARATIEPGSTIRTDGDRGLRRLAELGYTHEYVNMYLSDDKSQELPGVHLVASLLKRWLAGVLHFRVSVKQLPYYLDEYTFRFNRRNSTARGLLFYRLLQQALATDPHPLSELQNP